MYWSKPTGRNAKKGPPEGWKQPTQNLRMPYLEWLAHANQTDDSQLGPDKPHWYFRLIGCGVSKT